MRTTTRTAGFDSPESVAAELIYHISGNDLLLDRKESLFKNLATKVAQGVYDTALAPKLMLRLVDAAATSYATEYGSERGRDWKEMFPRDVRSIAANLLVEEFEQTVEGASTEMLELVPKRHRSGPPLRERMTSRRVPRDPRHEGASTRRRSAEFMEPMITEDTFIVLDGPMGGTSFPADLVDMAEVKELRREIEENGSVDLSGTSLADYTENEEAFEIEIKKGFSAYLSAPGYMDRTEDAVFDTEQEAKDYLISEFPESFGVGVAVLALAEELGIDTGMQEYEIEEEMEEELFRLIAFGEADDDMIENWLRAKFEQGAFPVEPRLSSLRRRAKLTPEQRQYGCGECPHTNVPGHRCEECELEDWSWENDEDAEGPRPSTLRQRREGPGAPRGARTRRR